MNRIEFNIQTGEMKVIELTSEELVDIEVRKAAEAATKEVPRKTLVDQILDDPAELAKLKAALLK